MDAVIHCLYDELIDPNSLKNHPKNRNKHGQDQIDRLAQLYKFHGVRHPIIISKLSGNIVAGHGRKLAAIRAGIKQMPVVYQSFENKESEYAFIQSDNAIALWAELDLSGINADLGDLGPDFDINMLGIKDFELEPADKYEDKDADAVPEVTESICKLGQIWKLGEHRLMCGDSTDENDVIKLFNDNKISLCFTSPPYSDQRDYSGNLELDTKHLAKFLKAPCELFVVNLGLQRKDGEIFSYWEDYINAAKEYGLKFLSWNVWNKMESGSIGNLTAMFPIEHEWIFVFGDKKELNRTVESVSGGKLKTKKFAVREKSGKITYRDNQKVTNEFKKLGTVVSLSPYKARHDGIKHPAMFPIDFPLVHIEALTKNNDNVYEPFCGSGTTLIACEKVSRSCFGMELDPHYCDVIIKRWEDFTGKKAELLNG